MPLEFTISAPESARVGQRVPVTLTLRNPSDRPVDAHFLGREIVFDIVVEAEDATIAWRRLADRTVPSILQIRTLAPGQAMEWRDHWVPRSAGHYRLRGVLPSDAPEPLRSDPVSVVVR